MNRLQKLQNVLDEIDEGIGFGPSEEILDESKVDQYIINFKEKIAKYPDIQNLCNTIFEDIGGKSLMEKLDEV